MAVPLSFFVKYVDGTPPPFHEKGGGEMNNLLKLRDIYKFYACVHMFKVTKMNFSPSLQSDL